MKYQVRTKGGKMVNWTEKQIRKMGGMLAPGEAARALGGRENPYRALVPRYRRNPAIGNPVMARFPGICSVCGQPFVIRSDEIVDTGMRGPKGGKKMAHVRCAGR